MKILVCNIYEILNVKICIGTYIPNTYVMYFYMGLYVLTISAHDICLIQVIKTISIQNYVYPFTNMFFFILDIHV